nr:MAG TPA: hypothetical protein [Caudoviricetes sp.]
MEINILNKYSQQNIIVPHQCRMMSYFRLYPYRPFV